MTIVAEKFDHVIGVDTHARTHTLVVLNKLGAKIRTDTFPTSPAGLKRAQAWIDRNAPGEKLVAMEGTGSYGALFAELLETAGLTVSETKPPKRGVRRYGKSDEIDAEHAARFALALPVEKIIVPRRHDGNRAAIRVLLMARRHYTKQRTETINTLLALLRTTWLGVDARGRLSAGTILAISNWRVRRDDYSATATFRRQAVAFAQAIRTLDGEISHNLDGLEHHVSVVAPWLLKEFGVGPFSAAQLIASWSHKDRIRSEAAFARLAGAAPIPASSGNTTRHRLHRGGDRQLNNALWVIANSRIMLAPNTTAYVERRTAEGKNRAEILRSLKRYLARSFYRKLQKMG